MLVLGIHLYVRIRMHTCIDKIYQKRKKKNITAIFTYTQTTINDTIFVPIKYDIKNIIRLHANCR